MRLLAALLLLPLCPSTSLGQALEQRWTLRDSAVTAHNSMATVPAVDLATLSLRPKRLFRDWDSLQEHSLRYDGSLGGAAGLRLEWNLLATLDFSSGASPLPASAQPTGRSAVLQRRLLDLPTQRFDAEVDQLALRWQGARVSVAAGRQSVNLGESFYFSPLDLFEPFVAQQSYRDFRPGVDAVRATVSPSHFSLVELIAVAGYAPQPLGLNTFDHSLRLDGSGGQGSLLARAQLSSEQWSGTALAGRVRREDVAGGAVQLEALGSSWTLEALHGQDADAASCRMDATLGLTRQWNASASSRLELNQACDKKDGAFSRQQTQAGTSLTLQASPLLTLTPAFFWYITDRNADFMLNASISVSDESVLELGFNAPILIPGHSGIGYGPMDLAPHTLSIELRSVL